MTVIVAKDASESGGFAISVDGEQIGEAQSSSGPEQRAVIAQLLGVNEDNVRYVDEEYDVDYNEVEVWHVSGAAA